MTESSLREFGAQIQRLINKEDLTEEETYNLFCEIMTSNQPDLQQGAFLAALVSKGETAEEIAGAWRAIVEHDTVSVSKSLPGNLFENSGTGMDSLKTFNVSSAAAITAAACGVKMARHGARALTSFCGTVDILESIGIDVECDVSIIEKSIKKTGIGLFNGMSPTIHPSSLGRILSQIRFGSTLNIAASLANPAHPSLGLRGVYSPEMVNMAAAVMPKVGYKKGMVVHGMDDEREGGMDEISITGETLIHEFAKNSSETTRYIKPEDVGLQTARFEDVATTGSMEKEKVRFLQVMAGSDHEACIDFTAINAGAILYTAGKAKTLEKGTAAAKDAISSGKAMAKLKSWVECQNKDPQAGLDKFEQVLKLSNIN